LLLSLAEGAPLRALAWAEGDALAGREQIILTLEKLAQGQGNPSGAAEQCLKIGAQQTLYWMYQWIADMIRQEAGGSQRYIVNHDLQDRLTKLAHRVGPRGLHKYFPLVNEALRLTGGQVNPQLLLENVLIAWQETFASRDQARVS